MTDTVNGEPLDPKAQRDLDWAKYQRWAVGPLMTREQWEAKQDRIASGQPLSTNPYEW